MDFPTWTLIGMGISAGLAILFTAAAYLAQSPNLLTRFRLMGSFLPQNGRRLTGLGLAATLVGGGFFMAGVPIGGGELGEAEVASISEGEAAANNTNSNLTEDGEPDVPVAAVDENGTVESGSFGNQPVQDAEEAEESDESEGVEGAETAASQSGAFSQPAQVNEEDSAEAVAETSTSTPAAPTSTPRPTNTPTATNTPAPTATPSPTPTNTPTPTATPTAIKDDTISVSFDGEITWVYRVPGNQQLQLVNNGDQLLLASGRAMVAGITWQEVRLLDGRPGWIQLSLLDLEGNE